MEQLIRSDAATGKFREGQCLKLSERPPEFITNFSLARKAIENDQIDELKKAVQALKGTTDPIENCLDVCEMVPEVKRNRTFLYPMTLLAFAGFHARIDMLEFLVSEGACVDMGNPSSGTPLLQMMKYAQIQRKQRLLDTDIVQFFIDNGAVLSRILTAGTCDKCTALELSINLHRIDMAQMLIEAGVDPIHGGDGTISSVFLEYAQFGTNEFVKWLLAYYEERGEIPAFANRLVDDKVFSKPETRHIVTKILGRNAAHTFLLSGHKEIIECLLRRESDLLKECDPFKKTALHIAAEKGDIDSVKILLDQNAAIDAEDDNFMTPLMLATKNGHEEVVKLVEVYSSRTGRKSDPMGLWSWALQYGYPAYFEALHQTEELEEILMSPLDNDENTIAHLAAEGGHVSVFKSTFPKTHRVPLFEILTKKNKQKKTPLQLAIEKGNIGILNALQERRADREKQASTKDIHQQQSESVEKKEWKRFWDSESPGLMLYACLHGTVDIVKYFVTKLVSPTTRLAGNKRYTPLSCAAKAGNHDIVAYLLSIKGVSAEGVATEEVSELSTLPEDKKPHSPLMLAAIHGHAKSVTLLLKKSADITVKSEREYNCLMESIEAGHEDVATAILTHPWTDTNKWKETMRWFVKKEEEIITPMRMLIEHMPGVAKLVLTKCISKDGEGGNGPVKQVLYDYEFIEDYCNPNETTTPAASATQGIPLSAVSSQSEPPANDDELWWLIEDEVEDDFDGKMESEPSDPPCWGPQEYSPQYHPLTLMVKHERLKLLQHPLISRYITHKWWKVVFFLFLLFILVYILFLIFLTSFTVNLPRPGPDDEFCPNNNSDYSELKLEDGECQEPDSVDRRAFTVLAVILILMSVGFLLFEVCVGYLILKQQKFPVDYETVMRVVTFLLTIIFVFGFWNDCWCAPPWQWQIGALAIFLAYINVVLLLKGMPVVGVPINMLLNIIVTFLKLIYLPILLISSFAIPFYMVFVRDGAAVLGGGAGILEAFSTPARSIAKAVMQTAGELDYETIFNEANLLYTPMAYILFISFVILMPILFSNLLVGLAVGTTEEDAKKAEFTNIQLQVTYIVEMESSKILRRWGKLPRLEYKNVNRNWIMSQWYKLQGLDYETQKNLVDELCDDTFDPDEENKEAVQVVKEKVTMMAEKMESLQEKIQPLERSHKQLQETLESNILENKERMTKMAATLQENIASLEQQLQEMLESKMEALQSSMSNILKKLGDE